MKEELNLFYKIWNKNNSRNKLTISEKNLYLLTRHDIMCRESIIYKIAVFFVVLILFVGVPYIIIPIFVWFAYKNPHIRKGVTKEILKIFDGISEFNNQNYREALHIFEDLKPLIRDCDSEFNSWLYYCYIQTKQYDKVEYLLKNYKLTGERIKKLEYCFETDNLQQLLEISQAAYYQIELNNKPTILAIIGSTLIKLNYPDIAYERLKTYSIQEKKLTEANCAYLYTLAKCEEALGNTQESQHAYRTILAFNPQFMDVKELVNN